jgi:hypothetical protein
MCGHIRYSRRIKFLLNKPQTLLAIIWIDDTDAQHQCLHILWGDIATGCTGRGENVKRLSPFEGAAVGGSQGLDKRQHDRSSHTSTHKAHSQPEESVKRDQCALPVEPDPRRTAFFAIISDTEDGLLYVQEAPIEIVPFRDTELVRFAYLPAVDTGDELLVTIMSDTCFDVTRPYQLMEPNTPVIVVGLDLGLAIAAEIIAGMDQEARYRPLLMRHQKSRQWYVASSEGEKRSRQGS